MTNFTLEDGTGACAGMLAFGAMLFCPGYLLTALGERLGLRRRSPLETAAWAVALSFATSPLAGYVAARAVSVGFACWCFEAAAVAALAVAGVRLAWKRRVPVRPRASDRTGKALGGILLLAVVLVVGELIDIQAGNGLFQSVTVLDQGYRVAFTEAIARTGAPPVNPLYLPGNAVPLRYYYFWYILCAVCTRLGRVSARQALMASSVWAGVGLAAVVALFGRHFLRLGEESRRFALWGSLLLGVTGLDLLPVLANRLMGQPFGGDMEWWSIDQVSSWLDTVLWVPNHLAALAGCLMAFLLLWQARRSGLPRAVSVGMAGGAAWSAAGAFGESIYVGLGFLALMLAWTAALVWGRPGGGARDWHAARRNLVAIALCGVLLLPFVGELLRAQSSTEGRASAGASHLLVPGVRRMIDPAVIPLPPGLGPPPGWPYRGADLLLRLGLLVPGYLVELGFFGLVLALAWRRRRQLDEPRRTALFFAVTGLALVTFVRSAVIGNNDFGYRAALLPSFFLLLLGADLLPLLLRRVTGEPSEAPVSSRVVRGIAVGMLLLGAGGTVFQACALRLYVPFAAARGEARFAGLPRLALAERVVSMEAARAIPPDAVVQANPTEATDMVALGTMLYSGRQGAMAPTADCGAAFGGSPAFCGPLRDSLHRLYAGADVGPVLSEAQARDVCARKGIGFLLALDRDGAWKDRAGWVWTLPAVASFPAGAANQVARVVDCRAAQGGSH